MHGKCYELKKQLWEIEEMKDGKILTLMMHALHKIPKWWRVADDDDYYDYNRYWRYFIPHIVLWFEITTAIRFYKRISY